MTYNIYVMSRDVKGVGIKGVSTPSTSIHPCDFDLTERLAKRLCKQYNKTWSSDKLYKGISTFPLDTVVGYVYYENSYEDSCTSNNMNEKLFKKLMKQQFNA